MPRRSRQHRGSETLPSRKVNETSTLPRANNDHYLRNNTLDKKRDYTEINMDPALINTPILCNRYVVGKNYGFPETTTNKGNIYFKSFRWKILLANTVTYNLKLCIFKQRFSKK